MLESTGELFADLASFRLQEPPSKKPHVREPPITEIGSDDESDDEGVDEGLRAMRNIAARRAHLLGPLEA